MILFVCAVHVHMRDVRASLIVGKARATHNTVIQHVMTQVLLSRVTSTINKLRYSPDCNYYWNVLQQQLTCKIPNLDDAVSTSSSGRRVLRSWRNANATRLIRALCRRVWRVQRDSGSIWKLVCHSKKCVNLQCLAKLSFVRLAAVRYTSIASLC